jgi:cation diffusion facilitator family transporter
MVALISGSMALLADAVNSFTDIFASFAVWVGLKLSRRKPTEMFPYGYYRAETFAMLAVSIVIVVSGVEIVREGIERYAEQTTLSYPILPLIASSISALLYYSLSLYKRKVGEMISSQSLISDSKNSMIDVYSSILVFTSILFTYIGFTWVDPIAGIIVGVYVIKTGLWFGKDAILALMDVCTSPERIEEIKKLAKGVKGVRGVHDVKLRRSGLVLFGEMHLEVDKGLAVIKAHEIADIIERKVKERFEDVESLTIHIEPVKRG